MCMAAAPVKRPPGTTEVRKKGKIVANMLMKGKGHKTKGVGQSRGKRVTCGDIAMRKVLYKARAREGDPVLISVDLWEYVFPCELCKAKALRDACDFANKCGHPRWSVVWDSRSGPRFYVPRSDGRRFSDPRGPEAVPIRVSPHQAVWILEPCWECLEHFGDVPGPSDRLEHGSDLGLRSSFPPYPTAACCWRKVPDDASDYGLSSTKRWVIDSGSGWDLVSYGNVSHIQDKLKKPQYIPRLWRANGVASASDEVPLYLPEFNEFCVLLLMRIHQTS